MVMGRYEQHVPPGRTLARVLFGQAARRYPLIPLCGTLARVLFGKAVRRYPDLVGLISVRMSYAR